MHTKFISDQCRLIDLSKFATYWHLMYKSGTGKEDFEGCERVLSSSNALASSTRLSSTFHRSQAIEEHIGFWTDEKYSLCGGYILLNHTTITQAPKAILFIKMLVRL